ncbi:hypothetical protein ECTPHS_05796 [Ectothiorhodospira sp. PHS-1]|nr:hypothetical protein ECTPHS_05796 [Ectothiorhodospira sp. PHS-1]
MGILSGAPPARHAVLNQDGMLESQGHGKPVLAHDHERHFPTGEPEDIEPRKALRNAA